jgi:cytochrome P450
MATASRRIPDGPKEKYNSDEDLLVWLGKNIEQYGEVFRASIYGTDVYVVNAPQYADHVLLKNWQNYPKGQAIKRIALLLGNGLMVSKGELWMRQRRMMQPAFNRHAMAPFAPIIIAANEHLLRKWEQAGRAGTHVNATRDISLMILEIVLRAIFGDDYNLVAPQFQVVSDEAARNLEFAIAFTSLGKIIVEIAENRRREGRSSADFLGLLMQARDRGSGEGMSDSQLSKEIMTLIVAGHETTASTLNWVWYLLAQNPTAERKLALELERLPRGAIPRVEDLPDFPYVRQVIEEALRIYPPGWLMTRKAIQEDQLGEYFVPAGTEIYIAPYYMQRHPGLWTAPDAFDPDRFDPDATQDRPALAMLPFSVGPRNCIGEHLARMEMQFHLIIIGSRLRMRLIGAEPPSLAAGVNLLSAHDFIMSPELKSSNDASI